MFPHHHPAARRQEYAPFFDLFNDTFNELQKLSESTGRTFAPKFDVKELQDKYVLEGELPGLEQKNVSIEFTDEQTLTIKGRSESYKEEGEKPQTQEATNDQSAQETNGKSHEESKEVATTGNKEVANHNPQHTYWVSERSVGEFARSFAFPNRVDHDNVKASLKNGILSIVVPKLQKAKEARKINIE
jgi:HSP20 family molecular chaperone IbpA